MKASSFFAAFIAASMCTPLLAQQVDADASDSTKTTYAPAAAGFGDDAASRSWEMTSVSGELDGKLDSKTAKVGDRVTLKTTEKMQTNDGTVIPRGSRLVGHVTEVQAHSNDRAIAQMAIAFDRIELKNGQSISVHSLIRTVRPSGSVSSLNSMDNDDMMSASSMGGGRMGGAGVGMRGGGIGSAGTLGANGSIDAAGVGNTNVGGTVDRTGTMAGAGTGVGANTNVGAAGAGPGNVGAGVGANQNGEVQLAGHGDAPIQGGAHAAAAARAVPHNTGIPGVMLAGSSTASGLLINADRRDLEFASGTRFEMGVVADR